MGGNLGGALTLAKQSLASHRSIETAIVAGILSLKAGRYSDAVEILEHAWADVSQMVLQTNPSQAVLPEYYDVGVFLARAYQFAGSTQLALTLMADLAADQRLEDENLRRIAQSNRPYSTGQLRRLMPPYSIYAPVE
jgi:hypothetical protein